MAKGLQCQRKGRVSVGFLRAEPRARARRRLISKINTENPVYKRADCDNGYRSTNVKSNKTVSSAVSRNPLALTIARNSSLAFNVLSLHASNVVVSDNSERCISSASDQLRVGSKERNETNGKMNLSLSLKIIPHRSIPFPVEFLADFLLTIPRQWVYLKLVRNSNPISVVSAVWWNCKWNNCDGSKYSLSLPWRTTHVKSRI